ncbi:MAG TPA: PAS domain S-box protein, partial [Abditibacteriaceae bacterium]|nr:PAS domain S-box protein [Abditibacteriaceae bacterium]
MAPLNSAVSAHFYHEFFERNPQPLWVYESESLRFVAVNQATIAVYGYSRDEFLAMTLKEICLAEDAALLSEYFANLDLPKADDASPAPAATVWRHCKKDGAIIEVEVLAHEMDWNGVPARLVTLRDVTQMRRMQRALQSLAAYTDVPSLQGQPAAFRPTSFETEKSAHFTEQADWPSLLFTPDANDDFFGVLAQNLALALDVAYATVTLRTPVNNTVRALGFWANKEIQAPIEYSIEETPCEAVLNQGATVYYPDGLQQLFPNDLELAHMRAASYYGAPIVDKDGTACGHLCVLDTKPLRDRHEVETIFQVFVVRATLEINRREAERRLRESEQHLRKSEEHLRTIFSSAPIIVFAVDNEGVFTFSDGKGLEVLGVKPGEALGHSIWERYSHAPEFLAHTKRALSGESFTEVGQVGPYSFQCSYAPQLNAQKQIVGAIGVATDLTDKLRAEAALVEAERKYRGLFESAVEGIFQTTLDGRCITANPMMAQILGYDSPGELISAITHIAQQFYVDPTRRDEFMRLMNRDGAVSRFESWVRRADGEIICISENARMLRDADGAVIGYEGTIIDVTDRKNAEAALRASENRLRDIVEHSSDLFYSHTPEHI